MGDFKIRIGMKTDAIMAKLSKNSRVTEKTKQLIQNFCNNDFDKKITNDVELAMLQSWLNGSEKVHMPKEPSKNDVSKNQKTAEVVFKKQQNIKTIFVTYDNGSYVTSFVRDAKHNINFDDTLVDNDNDGYADCRETKYYSKNGSPTYYDNDMNGEYD